jgi:hypothetical protein
MLLILATYRFTRSRLEESCNKLGIEIRIDSKQVAGMASNENLSDLMHCEKPFSKYKN